MEPAEQSSFYQRPFVPSDAIEDGVGAYSSGQYAEIAQDAFEARADRLDRSAGDGVARACLELDPLHGENVKCVFEYQQLGPRIHAGPPKGGDQPCATEFAPLMSQIDVVEARASDDGP